MLNRRAFTLIELLIVISIIGILITLVAVTVRPVQIKSRDARRKSDLNLYLSGLDLFKTDFKLYPNHTFYLADNKYNSDPDGNGPLKAGDPIDNGALTSYFDLGTDVAGCEGLSGAGNPNNFAAASSGIQEFNLVSGTHDYDREILGPGFKAVNNFLMCLKYIDRLVKDPTYGDTGQNGYQYLVSYDYVDVLVATQLENTNDTDLKTLFNPTVTKRYYLGSGSTVRHLDDDSDSDSLNVNDPNGNFYSLAFPPLRAIMNGKYLYQCNGKLVQNDIKRDDRSLTANEPITYSNGAWRANTGSCLDSDLTLNDIKNW